MGRATARLALERRAAVTLVGRSRERLAAAVAEVRPLEYPRQLDIVVADVEQPDNADRILAVAPVFDHVAVLTGGDTPASSIENTPLELARRVYRRLWVAYNILQAAGRHLSPRGSVTLISGSSSRRPVAGMAVWGALHGAVEALARNAVVELSPIRVNTVSPGGIGLGMDRQLADHEGTPDDIARAIVALMENDAITGALLDVDGGERLGSYSSPMVAAPARVGFGPDHATPV